MHGYPRHFQRVLTFAFGTLLLSGLLLVPGLLVLRLEWESVPWRASGDVRIWITGVHVFAGYAWTFLLGALWSRHMRNGWRVPHRRWSGGLQGTAALLLVTSALVILYAGEDRTALLAALTHLAAAVLAIAGIAWHVASARRRH